jgi:hypothetical protein
MLRYTLLARRGLWLFHDWEEARALWDRLTAIAPGEPLCLLPDRVLLIHPRPIEARLRAAMSGHARWLAHRWGWPGLLLWAPLGPPLALGADARVQAELRRLLEAPRQAALVEDPLIWSFSTLRDLAGLAWPQRLQPRWTNDRSLVPPPPESPQGVGDPDLAALCRAIGGVTRTPAPWLLRPGPPRRWLLGCRRALSTRSQRSLARELGISHSSLVRCPDPPPGLLAAAHRALGDPRIGPLPPGDLRDEVSWRRYRRWRAGGARGLDQPPAPWPRNIPASSKTSE